MEIDDKLRRRAQAIEEVLVRNGITSRAQLLPSYMDKNAHFDAPFGLGKTYDTVLRWALRHLNEEQWEQVFQAVAWAEAPTEEL
jgi:hypothetical protein